MLTKTDVQALHLSPTKRDFVQIWNELLEVAGKLSARWDPTSTNESDPGIVLLKALAGVADKLNYTIDKNILEAFLPTAAQEESIRKLCDMLGYSMKYYQSAKTVAIIKYHNPDEEDTEETNLMTNGKILPKFTVLSDANQECNYFTLEAVNFSTKQSSNTVSCMEGQLVKCESLNDNNVITVNQISDDNRFYLPEVQIAENGIFVYNVFAGGTLTNGGLVDGAAWEKVDNLNAKMRGSRIYKFGFDSYEGRPYIEFPDDYSSLFDDGLFIYYTRTSGSAGNISAHELSQIELPSIDNWNKISSEHFSVSNPSAATNGSDIESIEQAYKNFKKTIGTFDTLVTCRDYMNKIYSMVEDSTDVKMLSNILVTDIRDDINKAITICSCDDAGIFYKERALTQEVTSLANAPAPVFNPEDQGWHLGSIDGMELSPTQLVADEAERNDFKLNVNGIVDTTYDASNINDYTKYYYTIEQNGHIYKTNIKAKIAKSEPVKLIDHFDLILYPYKSYNQVTNRTADIAATFNNSFMYANKGKAIIAKLDHEQLKHSAHNLRTPNTNDLLSINNYVKLDATIATNERVTPIEGNEIINNIKMALANAFNMQELDFGEEIPFESLVNVIEGADPRIRVCSLNDPTLYTTFSVLGPKDAAQNYDIYEYAVASKYISTKTGESDEKFSYEIVDPALNNKTRKVSTFDTKIARQIYNKLVLRNVLAGRVPLFDYNKTFIASSAESPYQATTVHAENPAEDYLETPTKENPFTIYVDKNGVIYTGQFLGTPEVTTSYAQALRNAEEAAALAAAGLSVNDTTAENTEAAINGEDGSATINNASNVIATHVAQETANVLVDQASIFGQAVLEADPGQAPGLKLLADGVGGWAFAQALDSINNEPIVYTQSKPPFATKETVVLDNLPIDIPLEEPTVYNPVTTYADPEGNLYVGTYDATTDTVTYTKTQSNSDLKSSLLGANASLKNANNADESIDSNLPITAINGYCELPATECIVKDVVLQENEVVHFRAPNLITTKTFPAYVNYHLKLNEPAEAKTTTGSISNVIGQTTAEHAKAVTLFDLLNVGNTAGSDGSDSGWQKVLDYFKSPEGGSGKYVRTFKMTQKVSKRATELVTSQDTCDKSPTKKHEKSTGMATCKHCGAPMSDAGYNEDTGIALSDVDKTGKTLDELRKLIKKSGCLKLTNITPKVAWDTSTGDIPPAGGVLPEIPLDIKNPFFTINELGMLEQIPTLINSSIANALSDSSSPITLPTECGWTMTFEFECVPFEPVSLDAWISYIRGCKNGKVQKGKLTFSEPPIEDSGTILWRTYGEGYSIGRYVLEDTKKLMPFGSGYFGLLPDSYLSGIYLATSLGTDLVPRMIKSGDVHELQKGEYLLIEYTPAATETDSDPKSTTEVYYGGNSEKAIIIKPTGFTKGLQDTEAALDAGAVRVKDTVEFLNPNDTSIIKQTNGSNPVLLSIGANEQIELQELSRVELNKHTFNSYVYVYKNFNNELLEKIPQQAPGKVAKRSYTLKPNEYIFYTDSDKTEFAYYTSGTEVTLEGNAKIPKCKIIDIGSVLDGGVDLVPWQYCSLTGADKIIFQEYQYITLTAGDTINTVELPSSGNSTGADALGTSGTKHTGDKIDSEWQTCNNVSYTALGDTVQDSSSTNVPAKTTLPSLNLLDRAGNGWEVRSELLLTASPNLSQALRSTSKIKTGIQLVKTPTNGLQPVTVDISADSLLGGKPEDNALIEAVKARGCLTSPTEFWSPRTDSSRALEFKANFDCALNGQLGGSTDSITLSDAKRIGMDETEPSFQIKLFSPETPAIIRTAPGKVTPQVVNNKIMRSEEALDVKMRGELWQAANLSSLRINQEDDSGQKYDGALKLSVSVLPDTYGILSFYLKYNSTKSEQIANTWLEFVPGIDASSISILNRPDSQLRWEQEIDQCTNINSTRNTEQDAAFTPLVTPKLKLQPGLNCIKFKQSCYFFIKTSEITDGTLLFDDLRLVNTAKIEYKLESASTPTIAYTNGLNLDQIDYLSYPEDDYANITKAAAKELKMAVVNSAKKSLTDIATAAGSKYRESLKNFEYYTSRIANIQKAEQALINDLTNLCSLVGINTDPETLTTPLSANDVDNVYKEGVTDVLKYIHNIGNTLAEEEQLLTCIENNQDVSKKLQAVLDNISKYQYEPNLDAQVREAIEQIRSQLKNKVSTLTTTDYSEIFRSVCSDNPNDNILHNGEVFAMDATTGLPVNWNVSGAIPSTNNVTIAKKYDSTASRNYALQVKHEKPNSSTGYYLQNTVFRQKIPVKPLQEYSLVVRLKNYAKTDDKTDDGTSFNPRCQIMVSGVANANEALTVYEDARPSSYPSATESGEVKYGTDVAADGDNGFTVDNRAQATGILVAISELTNVGKKASESEMDNCLKDRCSYVVSMYADKDGAGITDWYTLRMNFTALGSLAQVKFDVADAEIDYIKVLPKADYDALYGIELKKAPEVSGAVGAFNTKVFRQKREDFIRNVFNSANSSLQELLQLAIDNVNNEASKETASKLNELATSMYLTGDRQTAVEKLRHYLSQLQSWLDTNTLDDLLVDLSVAISEKAEADIARLTQQLRAELNKPVGIKLINELLDLLQSKQNTINTDILELLWNLAKILGISDSKLSQFNGKFTEANVPTLTDVNAALAAFDNAANADNFKTLFNTLRSAITGYLTAQQTYTMSLITAIIQTDVTEPKTFNEQLDALLAGMTENENDALREAVQRVKTALEHQAIIRQALYTNAYTECDWNQLSALDEFNYVIAAAIPLLPDFLNDLIDTVCNILAPLASEYAEIEASDANAAADKLKQYYHYCTMSLHKAIQALFNTVAVEDKIRSVKNIYATNEFISAYKPLAKTFGHKISNDMAGAIKDVQKTKPNSKIKAMLADLKELAESNAIDSTSRQLELLPILRAELADAIKLDNQLIDNLVFYNTTSEITKANMVLDNFYYTFIQWVAQIRKDLLEIVNSDASTEEEKLKDTIKNIKDLLIKVIKARDKISNDEKYGEEKEVKAADGSTQKYTCGHLKHSAIYELFNNAVPKLPAIPTKFATDPTAEPYKTLVKYGQTLDTMLSISNGEYVDDFLKTHNISLKEPLTSKIINEADLADIVDRLLKILWPGTLIAHANMVNELIYVKDTTPISAIIALFELLRNYKVESNNEYNGMTAREAYKMAFASGKLPSDLRFDYLNDVVNFDWVDESGKKTARDTSSMDISIRQAVNDAITYLEHIRDNTLDLEKNDSVFKMLRKIEIEQQLLADILAVDIDRDFYYTAPVDPVLLIDLQEPYKEADDDDDAGDVKRRVSLMNPATNYDLNNVNNKFVVSKLDIKYLDKGLRIARSSLLN